MRCNKTNQIVSWLCGQVLFLDFTFYILNLDRDKSISSKTFRNTAHRLRNIVCKMVRDSWFQSSHTNCHLGDLLFLGQKHDTTSCEFESVWTNIWPIPTMFRLFIYTFCYLWAETESKSREEIGIHLNDDTTQPTKWQPNEKWITATSHYSLFIFIHTLLFFSLFLSLFLFKSTLHFVQFIYV